MTFTILTPGRVIFGRGTAAGAAAAAQAFGAQGVIVHGRDAARVRWLTDAVPCRTLSCPQEPDLPMVEAALAAARASRPDWVLAIGGGAVIDMGKALAALIPQPTGPLDHLELVGPARPLSAPPLPFVALPTTAGTGAEATKNAVIGLPELARKVSLRDDRMIPAVAIIDPALTDHCPRAVTLASGLDALTQVIEPYLTHRATPFTDALCAAAIPRALPALMRLMDREDPADRDAMAWVSLSGGLALANAGLGAVHGLAGVIGGMTGAAHGAICGLLLPHVLAMNRARMRDPTRADQVCAWLAPALDCTTEDVPRALAAWSRVAGLPPLPPLDPAIVVPAAKPASSMKANPVVLSDADLTMILEAAS
jgi:alcohol dehydrogenase class IV